MRMLLLFLFAALTPISDATAEPLSELKPLAPFVGIWTETKAQDAKGSPDVQSWEWAFRGQVMRIMHGSGSYGGESLIHWDGNKGKIMFRYVTNAGFYTDGVITPVDGGFSSHEIIGGTASGPKQIRAEYRISDAGKMLVTVKAKNGDKWENAFAVIYIRTPAAIVTYEN